MERNRGARSLVRITGVVAALALVLAACGGSDSSTAGASENAAAAAADSAQQVTLEASDNAFSTQELELPARETVELTFTNKGANPHTFTSSELGVDTGTVAPGESATVTFTVPDQAVEFLCSFHAGGGMTGVIVPQ
jgi:nitrite reductase (NO-forming)